MFSSVLFGGSRELPSCFGAFVGGVVGRVLAAAPRAWFAVGCAAGGDALALQSLAVRGAAAAGLGLLRWGCVWRGLLALLGPVGGPVRGCGSPRPRSGSRAVLSRLRLGSGSRRVKRGARPWRRPGVGRVLVSVLARVT